MKKRYQNMVEELTEKELIFHLYATQVILLIISIFLGLLIYKDLWFVFSLFDWSDFSILSVGITAGLFIVLFDLIGMKLLPKSLYDDGGLNEKIFQNRNVFHIAIISLIVAFSEELLFRGIIQTKLGLITGSIVFALVHYRYLFNWFLFINIISLSFVIGFIYQWTGNLAVTFIMHFIVDFLLGFLLMKRSKKSRGKGVVGIHE
ncbi:CPBP family intramembrane glutamic endopeptidase [Bacillus sp. CGMCC 1.16607]|uniref:CPBP family intramembrane glutamic endopeptidase n=1 Tax=Bacillus sp. CGMCC 1.16607 TaxID=3351842 RepID=UPI003642B980